MEKITDFLEQYFTFQQLPTLQKDSYRIQAQQDY